MPTDLDLGCVCGSWRALARGVSPRRGNRVKCFCDDCQAFAHFLGCADDVLDEHGGTEIFQMSPGKLELGSGQEHLACMRLKPKGIVRWYSSCCRTPIGNTLATPKLPFVGLVHRCIRTDSDDARERALGPVRGGVHGRFAKGDRTAVDAHDKAPLSLLLRFMGLMLGARLRGEHRKNPLFDPGTGALVVAPKVLTREELEDVSTAQKAWSAKY